VGGLWSLDELVQRVAQSLTATGVRAPNGRVNAMPDARMIRWYATVGLVDKPSAMRGRTSLYGVRHLLQVVAIKRLQAQGRTLAEIQLELAGATEATLRRIAAVPDAVLAGSAHPAGVAPGVASCTVNDAPSMAGPQPGRADPELDAGSQRATKFWTRTGVQATTTQRADLTAADAGTPAYPVASEPAVGVLMAIEVGHGAMLLLACVPSEEDIVAIRTAAAPLLEVLAARGLDRSHPLGRSTQ
jgi:hypothetical protein